MPATTRGAANYISGSFLTSSPGSLLASVEAYYGITGNSLAIARLFNAVKHVWRKALERRSQQRLPWRKMQKLLERFPLPAPRIVHKYGT